MELPVRENIARLREEPNEGFANAKKVVLEEHEASCWPIWHRKRVNHHGNFD